MAAQKEAHRDTTTGCAMSACLGRGAMAREKRTLPPSFSSLASDAVQLVFGSAEAKAGVRLASCSRFLHHEAKRCQTLWDGVLDQGSGGTRATT